MKTLKIGILAALVSLASCFVFPSEQPPTDPIKPVEIQVVIIPQSPGCALSKVRVYDDLGGLYQAIGCNDGTVTLGDGRSLGWVELFGVPTIGWSVYQIR